MSGKGNQCLDARVPVLLAGCVQKILAVEVAVLLQPLLRLNHLERISGRGENLTQEGVRVERYRRDHIIELLGSEQGGVLLRLLGAQLRTLLRTLLIV